MTNRAKPPYMTTALSRRSATGLIRAKADSQRGAHTIMATRLKDTEVVVNTIFDAMTEALRRGERIEIRGFGSFQVKVREARDGRNPKTGEMVNIPAKRTPFFKVGKELKEMVDAAPAQPARSGVVQG